jgi:hypothetical protein
MNRSSIKATIAKYRPRPRRGVLAALLCAFGAAALALAILAGSALAASLVKNGSFEKDGNGDGLPNNWSDGSSGISPKRTCNQAYVGNCSFKFVFSSNLYKDIYQEIAISGSTGDTYKLTFWMKGKEITGAGVVFVNIFFLPDDGSGYSYPSDGTSPWTKYSLTADATGDFTSIRIEIFGNENSGKAWFDSVKLVEVP